MAVHVAEIGGKAVPAFGAEDGFAAEQLVDERWRCSDLRALNLQDGSTGIAVREAQEDERQKWREGRRRR